MDYLASFQIGAMGMAVEKLRMDVTAINIANMRVSHAPGAAPVRALRVVVAPVAAGFQAQYSAASEGGLGLVGPTASVVGVTTTPNLVHEPSHPHADSSGYVRYPGINHSEEMMNMLSAMRAYEANIAALGAARAMAVRALEIGGTQ